MSGRFKHCRAERRSPLPVFGVTEPDHSRPRHGKVCPQWKIMKNIPIRNVFRSSLSQ